MKRLYNYVGKEVKYSSILYQDSSYGWIDDKGICHTNWAPEDDICDGNGFDKRYRPSSDSAEYVVRDYILPKGIIICRYGSEHGRFTAPDGTDYNTLSLPYVQESIEFHRYLVSQDISVSCVVSKGKVAPMFASPGGAIQYMHRQTINLECEDGKLKEIIEW